MELAKYQITSLCVGDIAEGLIDLLDGNKDKIKGIVIEMIVGDGEPFTDHMYILRDILRTIKTVIDTAVKIILVYGEDTGDRVHITNIRLLDKTPELTKQFVL